MTTISTARPRRQALRAALRAKLNLKMTEHNEKQQKQAAAAKAAR